MERAWFTDWTARIFLRLRRAVLASIAHMPTPGENIADEKWNVHPVLAVAAQADRQDHIGKVIFFVARGEDDGAQAVLQLQRDLLARVNAQRIEQIAAVEADLQLAAVPGDGAGVVRGAGWCLPCGSRPYCRRRRSGRGF